MSNYTFATVIIAAEDQSAAQADLGEGFFNTPLSTTGEPPATHYMSTGPFDNTELDMICNTVSWPKTIYFGQDWQAAIDAENLKVVVEPPVGEE
jgi:hypothetical protein